MCLKLFQDALIQKYASNHHQAIKRKNCALDPPVYQTDHVTDYQSYATHAFQWPERRDLQPPLLLAHQQYVPLPYDYEYRLD